MNKAHVVIGSGYGDEGKGLITDYLTRKHHASTVVRFNGGAQAGHTVCTDSQRHVFKHFSAGTFAKANTYLSKDFILNPQQLHIEHAELDSDVLVQCDPRCIVTTVYDIALNWLAEYVRGDDKHGSCGMGINETVERSSRFAIIADDLKQENVNRLAKLLETIYYSWIPQRLAALNIRSIPYVFHELTAGVLLSKNFNHHAQTLIDFSKHLIPCEYSNNGHVILEGAQGLGLDEDLGAFPHVTRSKTGLPNAVSFCQENEIKCIDAVYVTRAYATRHGRGPLLHEKQRFAESNIVCKTNSHNDFQESLRYAPLDLAHLKKMIHTDLSRANCNVSASIAVTCLDQSDTFVLVIDDRFFEVNAQNVAKTIEDYVGIRVQYESYGETARTILDHELLNKRSSAKQAFGPVPA